MGLRQTDRVTNGIPFVVLIYGRLWLILNRVGWPDVGEPQFDLYLANMSSDVHVLGWVTPNANR